MKNRPLILAITGLAAAFFAIVLNLATTTGQQAHILAAEAFAASLVALFCGVVSFRKGGGWRFLGIAMIGPSVFVLADSAMRVLLYLRHGV